VGIALLAGCSPSSPVNSSPVTIISAPASGFRGTQLARPLAKPQLRLTDTHGAAYDLHARTAGKLTLLYFGYTHCPDACPTTMADLAAALRTLPAEQRMRIAVVFVTTDPDRDTGPLLRAWLNAFDPSFVGLTGAFATIQQAARSVGVLVEAPVRQSDGTYRVDHGAEVLAFGPDGLARVVFLSSTATVADYTHDLPLLLAGKDTQ